MFLANVLTALDAGLNSTVAIRKNGSLAYNGFGGNGSGLVGSFSGSFINVSTQPILLATSD